MPALDTSAEQPAPVRQIATLIAGYIDRLGDIWVEGQIAELTRRPNTPTVWIILRDTVGEASIQVSCPRTVMDSVDPPVVEGAKVVLHAKFQYYIARGTLSMRAIDIRPVGLGDLLARIEQRRRLLAAEGVFDSVRKRRLPFLPSAVGLIAGRASAAERDVVENARRRWPGVVFRIENCPVQGPDAVRHVVDALRRLDRDPAVEVIVIARGGGSVEDLLPFSDEGLVRAVSSASSPVVSAIGHDVDNPLLDLVADVRASTPTDAAKLVVPDVREQSLLLGEYRHRARRVVDGLVDRERQGLRSLRTRPVLAQPDQAVAARADAVRALVDRGHKTLTATIEQARSDTTHQEARLRSLAPLATLQRGYAVVIRADGRVVTSTHDVSAAQPLTVLVSDGRIHVVVDHADSLDQEGAPS